MAAGGRRSWPRAAWCRSSTWPTRASATASPRTAAPCGLFVAAGLDFFVATSFSKSFSLYGERVGALSVVCASADEAARVLSQLKRVIRTNYSNPPTHGAAVVATVLATPALRAMWEDELAGMRERIKRMRVELRRRLEAAGARIDTDFITRQRGMFSYSGLSQGADAAPAQRVRRLRRRFRPHLRGRAERQQSRRRRRGDRQSQLRRPLPMLLYQWYEAQRALMSPFSEFASASSKLYNHPLSPFAHTPMAQRVSAGLELMHRLAKDYEKPEFDIRSVEVDGIEVAVHEQVAIDKPFCRLLRFKRFTDDLPTLQRMKAQPTVLVVAPLSGHHSTLLRDTVRKLLQDHKVYITDWTDARMVPREQGPVPPRRLRRLRAGVHPPHRPRGARDLGLPADRAGAGGGLADGERTASRRRAR